MSYQPPRDVLERYASLLVGAALGHGAGIKTGDTVLIRGGEETKPLFIEVARAVWRAGGNVLPRLAPSSDGELGYERSFYELASDEQLAFFPERWALGMIEQADHLVGLLGEQDPKALAEVDPHKMLVHQQAYMPLMRAQTEKEDAGRLTWTVALYGTEAMAAEAGLTLEGYWEQIIRACHLDDPDPIARWQETQQQLDRFLAWLNALPIERLHMVSAEADIWFTFGERRKWVGGSGRNVPSFEIFTSPDWRGTDGFIRFSEPLYIHGQLVLDAELEFRDGLVVRADARENAELLREIIAAENGNRVGELSLTDARLSRIDHFMASTLYDENMGGPFGNTHVAIGLSLTSTYDGDPSELTPERLEQLGYNTSAVHTDIVSTTDRTVTAVMRDGSERVIYADGRFQLD